MSGVNMKLSNLSFGWLLFFVLLTPMSVLALATDKDQPIHIEADSLDFDEKKEIAIYRGNVILKQGSIRIHADVLTIFGIQDNTDKIIATGKPATFKQRPDGADEDIHGEALQLEYYSDSDLLLLLGEGVVRRGKETLSSERIEYDRRNALVKAGSRTSSKQRVTVILKPQHKNTE